MESRKKVQDTKPHSSGADGWENPYGTGAGQIVTSIQDNWQARLARLGATRMNYQGKTAMVQGVTTGLGFARPSKGNVAFITHAIISTDGPGVAYMGYSIGNDTILCQKYLPSAGSFEIKFDGVVMVRDEFSMSFRADNVGTNAYSSVIWLEVHE